MNQLEFFEDLYDKTGTVATVINSCNTFNAKRVPFTEYDFKKNTIGRYVLVQEIATELDIHNSINLEKDWQVINKTAVDFVNSRFNIPIYLFDSGRGIHLNIFTKNIIEYSEKNEVKPRELAKEIWKLLGFKSSNTDNCLLNRRQNSVIRAEGGFNVKSNSFKSNIPGYYKPKQFYKKEEIVYPEIELWNVPVLLLKKGVLELRKRELLNNMTTEIPNISDMSNLPCFKNLLTIPIPPTGKTTRNILASIIAFISLKSGDENTAIKNIEIYENNCIKIDPEFPRGSQRNWINTIKRTGLDNWKFDCGMIKHYENILKNLGVDITLCNKCEVLKWKK